MAASIIVISLRKLQQSKVPPRKLPKNKRLSSTQMMILQHLLASQLKNTSKRTIIHSISNKNSSRQSMIIPTTLNSSNSSSSMWNRGNQVLWCANRNKFSSSQSFRKKFICHQRLSPFHRKPLRKLSCSMTPTTSWRSLIDRHQNLRKRK
jgi:hypothetical protein